MTRYLMNLALVGLIVSMFLSLMLLPPRPKKYSRKRYIYMFLQWVLVPITAPFLGAMPAVDSQTRILFGKIFRRILGDGKGAERVNLIQGEALGHSQGFALEKALK